MLEAYQGEWNKAKFTRPVGRVAELGSLGVTIMDRQFADARYWTEYVADNTDGFAGLRLHRERRGKTNIAAEVIFWDAVGQYFVQTFDGEVPVEILEAVIAETKERVGVR